MNTALDATVADAPVSAPVPARQVLQDVFGYPALPLAAPSKAAHRSPG